MNRKHAVRLARECMIMEILTTSCPICNKDLHGDMGINPDEWDKAIQHLMTHTDKERKERGIMFKGRDASWDGLKC